MLVSGSTDRNGSLGFGLSMPVRTGTGPLTPSPSRRWCAGKSRPGWMLGRGRRRRSAVWAAGILRSCRRWSGFAADTTLQAARARVGDRWAQLPADPVGPLRLLAVLPAAKFGGWLSRVLRRGSGDSLPGVVGDYLLPQLGGILARQLTRGVIIVTGTNGKTTTTKLLGEMLTLRGEEVVSNRSGSNMKQGIVSSLIAAAGVRGALRGSPTIGLFEVDEATVPLVVEAIGATDIVVTNLFRDQLDRFGEVDAIATTVGKAIHRTNARVYLNADDPTVASLSRFVAPERLVYFGLESPADGVAALKTAVDSAHCPRCDATLRFSRTFYSHLGHYQCPRGDFARPGTTVAVSGIERADAAGSVFTVQTTGHCYRAEMSLGGVYNIYNALAAVTVARGVGVPIRTALRSLEAAKSAFGRVEEVDWDGRLLQLILVKNPAGFTQVLDTFLRSRTGTNILIAVNDLEADGRDVSWLWDVPFECLAGRRHNIIAAGTRAGDVAVRLHYAEVESTIIESVPEALEELHRRTGPGGQGYLLTTYTAMLSARRRLGQAVAMSSIGSVNR